jgi:hypothetical protein
MGKADGVKGNPKVPVTSINDKVAVSTTGSYAKSEKHYAETVGRAINVSDKQNQK